MAGHSKWANIKHKKARSDAKRGKLFSKLVKEIMVAAKMGGGDPDGNPRLRTAIDRGKSLSLPAENIERAIKKGSGELQGVSYEEGMYEGYGPKGVAVIVSYMTDNKNRTVSEVRSAFTKHNGNLGESGSVSWIFEKRGYFTISGEGLDEESLMDIALEAGADDVVENPDDGVFEVFCDPNEYHKVKTHFDTAGIKYTFSEITMIPKNTIQIEGKAAKTLLKLLDVLEDLDDVQDVYANFDMSAEDMDED